MPIERILTAIRITNIIMSHDLLDIIIAIMLTPNIDREKKTVKIA